MRRMGSAARTASVKIKVRIFTGELGSARKIWWISGRAEYRAEGVSAAGVEPSVGIEMEKTPDLNGVEVPKLPITMEARRGVSEDRRAIGILL
jgi:hypothetical protein